MGPDSLMAVWSVMWVGIMLFLAGLCGYVLILAIKALKKYLREDTEEFKSEL